MRSIQTPFAATYYDNEQQTERTEWQRFGGLAFRLAAQLDILPDPSRPAYHHICDLRDEEVRERQLRLLFHARHVRSAQGQQSVGQSEARNQVMDKELIVESCKLYYFSNQLYV